MRAERLVAATVAALFGLAPAVWAGSTEPELAIAAVTASVYGGVVTLEVAANYDHANALRLGYPVAVVVERQAMRVELFLDGRATLSVDGGPATPVAGARGVIAVAPTRITAVLPDAVAAAGTATVRLEASFDGAVLRSNAAAVSW